MKTCKCIKSGNFSLIVGNYYYYEINYHPYEVYPYHIYSSLNLNKPFANFSKKYFDNLFIDIIKERKQKLKKLNEIN